MKNRLSSHDLEESRILLEQLFDAVRGEEATLASGTALDIGANTLQVLRKTKITFGNPTNDLIKLTEKLFNEIDVELSTIHKRQMRSNFDFYYMTLSVLMHPGIKVRFKRVECILEFGPKGEGEPIVHTMFPKGEWRELLRLGGGVNLALDGKLQWQMGLDSKAVEKIINLPGKIKANVANKNRLNAYIAIPNYTFEIGCTEIVATGEGNSECFWRIEDPGLKKTQTVKLGVVFKVPKGITLIELSGLVAAEPDFNWLLESLHNVFEYLSARFQRLLRSKEEKRSGKNRLPIGVHEKWVIQLPK